MNVRTVQDEPVSDIIEGHAPTHVPPSRRYDRLFTDTDDFEGDGRQVARSATHTAVILKIPNLAAFDKHYETLNVDQKKIATFLKEWSGPGPHLLLVSGAAGSGKSHAVIETLKYFNGDVLKLAYTNEVAQGIGGRTIHSKLRINFRSTEPHSIADITNRMLQNELILDTQSYLKECEAAAQELIHHVYRSLLHPPHVLVVDEVCLLPYWFALSLIRYYGDILFVMLGDEFQLKPVHCRYNIFSFPPSTIPTTTVTLTRNNRFTPEYHEIIDRMRTLVTEEKSDEMMEFLKANFPIRQRILESDLDKISLVLAYKNETVNDFNMKFLNRIDGEWVRIPAVQDGSVIQHNALLLKPGCKIVTTRETLQMPKGAETSFSAFLSDSDRVELMNGVKIKRDRYEGQFPIAPAYCFTIHKYQGKTLDRSGVVFYFDGHCQDLNLIYTALSRVRKMDQIYAVVV